MPVPKQIRQSILDLLEQRGPGKTICPSEVARAVALDDWRPVMPLVREVVSGMVAEGVLLVTQAGQVVDPAEAKGAIRLRLPD